MMQSPAVSRARPGAGCSPSTDEFETGVADFAATLRAFVRRRVGDPADADDITQNVLLKVFRARGSLRDRRKLQAWVYQAARTAIVDHYRRRRPAEEIPAGLAADDAGLDEVGERMRRAVRRFLTTLPELYRRPLLLTEFEGRTVAEVARELKITTSAAKSRLARGRALLRKKLDECCRFETDRFGRIIDFRQKQAICACEGPVADVRLAPGAATAVRIEVAGDGDEKAIVALLASAGLPTRDLTAGHFLNFLTAKTAGHLVGCAGIEPHGDTGLLRSVVVVPGLRGTGVGRAIVAAAGNLARQLGVEDLFLITNTAEHFFARLGYARADRADVPEAIRATAEFGSLCPVSAAVMRRRIEPRPRSG